MSGAHGPAGSGLGMQVYLSPTRTISGDRTFSPVSSTLFTGEEEAVLVDAQFHREDVAALGDMVERSGRRLTHIYVTHGHFDHYFGAGAIAARFPGARVVALPTVVRAIATRHDGEVAMASAMFADQAASPSALPVPMESDTLELEGRVLRAIEIGQGDISPSTALHAPDLEAVAVGDIAYDGIHMMLGLTGPEEWARWVESLDEIERLGAHTVVVGHRRPDLTDGEADRILGSSRRYIQDFADAATREPRTDAIVAAMRAKYPDFGNLTTLYFSAGAAARRLAGTPT